MVQRINKIYWITHPAFSVIGHDKKDLTRRPAPAIASFIKGNIVPVVEQAAKEPNSLVVLVKTNYLSFRQGYSSRGVRQGLAIEKRLEKLVLEKLGERAIISKEQGAKNAAPEVLRQILSRGFSVNSRARIIGYGSYLEWCAGNYPKAFKKHAELKSWISVSREGTLPLMPRRAKSIARKRLL